MKKNNVNNLNYLAFKSGISIYLVTTILAFSGNLYAQNNATGNAGKQIPLLTMGVTEITKGIQAPTAIVFPNKNEIWVTEQSGKIRVIKEGRLLPEPLIDLKNKLMKLNAGYEERGLLGITLHPQFAENKKIYVYYSRVSIQKSNHTGVLAEYRLGPSGQIDEKSERIVLTVEEPQGNHNGGCIQFGPDKFLYLSLGDGGGQGDEHGKIGNGQDLTNWHGKILRIDVNTDSGYLVPKDNPFIARADAKPEIWAYGFRNPWRFSFDRATGRLFAGDVGQSTWEEVDIVTKGGDYGWRLMEGTHCYNPATGCDITKSIMPIAEYHHREGVSVTGGYIYNGSLIPQLKNKYLFADWTGRIYYLQGKGKVWNRGKVTLKNLSADSKITAFGEDASGEIYILTNTDTGPENSNGSVYKVVKN
ncbi:glucose dehydrogenase [Pedobacter frigidisoli]|uniref:Glucose dehydrogenase n=1 Tax=Pedobacter frigidisoli TaxID=2530455 RepID=A0A4R0NW52_9SPHI|nr:PQQ-dependent sugar dehydrogenase [Pedobacter frigidisoli]TCD05922.1 glucose dehydrogenase [Pedobacter frigidisoli]